MLFLYAIKLRNRCIFTMLHIICKCKTGKANVTMQFNHQKLKSKCYMLTAYIKMKILLIPRLTCLLDPFHSLYIKNTTCGNIRIIRFIYISFTMKLVQLKPKKKITKKTFLCFFFKLILKFNEIPPVKSIWIKCKVIYYVMEILY